MIEATNMIFITNFNVIGGVETFIYELVKKYKDIDIMVVYSTGDYNQIARIVKYARIKKFKEGITYKCRNAFFNYENYFIDHVEAEEYVQIIHAMYKTNHLKPRIHPKITKYIAVSNIAAEEWHELTGIKPEVVRNPLDIKKGDLSPVLYLVSATRLTQEKGKARMEKLGRLLNARGVNYLWLVFTNDNEAIKNPNIVYIEPRLNVRDYLYSLKGQCYGVQLSDCEGDCYFTRECEAMGIPLLVTPVASFKEQGLKDGVNCYYLPFDMQDIDIDRIVNHIPKYDPYGYEDGWKDQLANVKSNYEEVNMKIRLRCIRSYTDMQRKEDIPLGFEWNENEARAKELLRNPNELVEVVEYIEEPVVEKAVKPKRKVTKR